jgi:hypothetical protein
MASANEQATAVATPEPEPTEPHDDRAARDDGLSATPDPVPDAGATASAALGEAASQDRVTRRRRQRSVDTGPPTRAAEEPPPVTAPPARAFLRVPRLGQGQERVVVDGRPVGFTPTVVEVAAGSHTVEVRSVESDAVIVTRRVDLTAAHTHVSPLVVR